MQIDTVFLETPIVRFETKRTKGRIIKAYAIPVGVENPRGFEKNIIIGTLPNTKNITSEQFAKVGIKTIQSTFQWYKKYNLIKKTISCSNKEEIEIYIHTYYITLPQEKELKWYYIWQAYFADKTKLYTFSAASDVEQDIERFEQYYRTIKCTNTTNNIDTTGTWKHSS